MPRDRSEERNTAGELRHRRSASPPDPVKWVEELWLQVEANTADLDVGEMLKNEFVEWTSELQEEWSDYLSVTRNAVSDSARRQIVLKKDDIKEAVDAFVQKMKALRQEKPNDKTVMDLDAFKVIVVSFKGLLNWVKLQRRQKERNALHS